jgi:hypothetical protein
MLFSSTVGPSTPARWSTTAVLLLVIVTRVPSSAAQTAQESIGLFFDSDCATCSATMMPGQQRTLEIRAVRGGATQQFDLAGGHFQVIGLPPGWTAACVPNPAATFSFGDPFGDGGSLLFPCVSGTCVELYRCTITATTAETARLSVVSHSQPQGCPSGCPCIAYCAPQPTATCASGGTAIINGAACTVAAQPLPWSQVKRLFD